MKIITTPHPTLRDQAAKIEVLDKKNTQLIKELGTTLKNHRNPKGVGLAAPQVDVSKQLFVTYLPANGNEEGGKAVLRSFINPRILDHSSELVYGHIPDEPRLEGCLSIPGLYGPVPRWQWIEIEFLDDQFETHRERFVDFAARVVQHEYDHLIGKLFTDYSLEYDLPVYREDTVTEKLVEIDKRLIEGW